MPPLGSDQQARWHPWQPDGWGWRGRLGLLLPHADIEPDTEFATLAPEGVSTHVMHVPCIVLPIKAGDPGTEYTVADRKEVSHTPQEMGCQKQSEEILFGNLTSDDGIGVPGAIAGKFPVSQKCLWMKKFAEFKKAIMPGLLRRRAVVSQSSRPAACTERIVLLIKRSVAINGFFSVILRSVNFPVMAPGTPD